MASEILMGKEADEMGHKVMREGQLMFAVLYDPERHQTAFLGTDILTAALTQGMEVEKYVNDKIAQARERLVKKQ